jgi:uncharacterized membrane protein YhaH (DUF805 family)
MASKFRINLLKFFLIATFIIATTLTISHSHDHSKSKSIVDSCAICNLSCPLKSLVQDSIITFAYTAMISKNSISLQKHHYKAIVRLHNRGPPSATISQIAV